MTANLRFFSLNPEALNNFPITQARNIDFEWVEKAKIHYSHTQIVPMDTQTTRCPGIFSTLGRGWIQRTYADIFIDTCGDNESVKYAASVNQKELTNGHLTSDYISYHSADQLHRFKDFTPNTLATVLKIQSPWGVTIPEGYSLLVMPVPYNDDTRFTSAIGILKGTNFLNVQLFWHCLNSSEKIPAGTPIQQYVLLKDEKVEEQIELYTDEDIRLLNEYTDKFMEKFNTRKKQ